MPEALHVQPAPAGAARHREHVAGSVVGRQRRAQGPPPAKRRRRPRRTPFGQARADSAPNGPSPTSSNVASGTAAGSRAGPHQRVLSLARHQPGHAQHHRAVAQPVAARLTARAAGVGAERRDVDARRQPVQRLPRGTERPGEPPAGVLAQVGDHVAAGADPAQRLRAAGSIAQPTSCPWVLATIRRAPARRRAGASRPSGAAAPNQTAVAAVLAAARPRPGGHARPASA